MKQIIYCYVVLRQFGPNNALMFDTHIPPVAIRNRKHILVCSALHGRLGEKRNTYLFSSLFECQAKLMFGIVVSL